MLSRSVFVEQALSFLEQVYDELEKCSTVFPLHWHIDHLCYRVATLDRYLQVQNEISNFSELLAESPVNGRLISTYALKEPISFRDHIIRSIELPAPKPGKPFLEGFEHMELVCDRPLETLCHAYPRLQWQAPTNKYYNSEVRANLGSLAIKFHHQSLQSVVTLEQNHDVYQKLVESAILTELRNFNPLVAGTFPLGVHTSSSDVDIIISHPHLQDIREICLKYYSHLPEFQLHTSCILNQDTLVVRFRWNELPMEIFAQTKASFEQNGYRHFIVEERLLKIGGPKFSLKVAALRLEGLKTEPAFTDALGFTTTDPFKTLAGLWNYSDKQLSAFFKNC